MDPRRILSAVTSLDSQAKSSASQIKGLVLSKMTNRSVGMRGMGDYRGMVMGSTMAAMDDIFRGIANPVNTTEFESEINAAVDQAQAQANPYSGMELGQFSTTLRKDYLAKVKRNRATIHL